MIDHDGSGDQRGGRDATPSGPVVLAACGACRSTGGDLAAGVILGAREHVDVPAGGELRLAFSLSEALVDSQSGVSVDGPAEVAATADGVVLDRGRARVSTASHAVVRTPQVIASSKSARWIVESGPRGTRVDVLSGQVTVTSSSGAPTLSLTAGQHVTVDEHGRLAESDGAPPASVPPGSTVKKPAPIAARAGAAPSSSSAPSPPGTDRWLAARRALDRGDRASAEGELRALLAGDRVDEALAPRAAFLLAEIELARGASSSGRLRLEELLRTRDPQLAEDAAALLARAYRTADERSRVWASYVAVSPPSPRRERAMLEQARALAAAGKYEEAKSIASRLCEGASPADVCRASRALFQR